jgi:hypothetical protein
VYLSDVLCGICTYQLDYTKMLELDATSYPLWPKAKPGDPLASARMGVCFDHRGHPGTPVRSRGASCGTSRYFTTPSRQ